MSDEFDEIPDEAYQLKDFLITTANVNKYDYNTMLKDLESSSRHEDHLKKIKKKWMDESKKYKETIEHMKEYQEETYQKKNKELVKRLKKKEQILLTALKNNQKSRMKERQKMFEALMQKEKQSRQNVQNFLIKQEKERQKLQIDNNGKIKSFIERNQKKKNEIHENFSKRNKNSEMRHDKNVIEVNKENEKLESETREKEFQKYVTYYFLKKSQHQSLTKKKKERSTKEKEKSEKLEEIDRALEEKRKDLFKRMQKMDKKRTEILKSKEEKILENKMERESKTINVRRRLTEMEEIEGEKRRDILDYQQEMMNRSLKLNDANNNKKRFNTGENTITNQMAIQRHMMTFMKKLNTLKSQSITKKSLEKRIKIFKELKRQEAERKKREKEDELLYKDH